MKLKMGGKEQIRTYQKARKEGMVDGRVKTKSLLQTPTQVLGKVFFLILITMKIIEKKIW